MVIVHLKILRALITMLVGSSIRRSEIPPQYELLVVSRGAGVR
jgi:hypothetical protein